MSFLFHPFISLAPTKNPWVLPVQKQNLVNALFKSCTVFEDAGVFNSVKLREKPSLINLSLNLTVISLAPTR